MNHPELNTKLHKTKVQEYEADVERFANTILDRDEEYLRSLSTRYDRKTKLGQIRAGILAEFALFLLLAPTNPTITEPDLTLYTTRSQSPIDFYIQNETIQLKFSQLPFYSHRIIEYKGFTFDTHNQTCWLMQKHSPKVDWVYLMEMTDDFYTIRWIKRPVELHPLGVPTFYQSHAVALWHPILQRFS